VGMTFAPEDMDEGTWNGLSVQASLRPAEEKGVKPFVRVTFKAQEGKGEALEEQFKKVLTEARRHFVNKHALFDMVNVSTDDDDSDKVHIAFHPDEHSPVYPEEVMAAKPSMDISIKTGRDFEEMVDNIHGCEPTLPGGFQISASTKLAKAIIDTVEDFGASDPRVRRYVHPLAAFSKLSSHTEMRYDTAALEADTCDEDEMKRRFQQVKRFKENAERMLSRRIGVETVKAASELTDFADHLHSVHVGGGLPGDYEIYIEFENFKLTPVIAKFLQR